MPLQTQSSYAPNSPHCFFSSRSMEFYYSAPPSPRRTDKKQQKGDLTNSIFDDFEFETSRKFNYSPIADAGDDTRRRVRGDSLPTMAFADELFVNGLVMPLKLPPRLQNDSDLSFSQKSPVSSPKSPRTVLKNPFARKNAWNDDFDPFMVALEKVREEKRNSYHRRSMSQKLPFKVTSKSHSDIYLFDNRDNDQGNSPAKPTEVLKHSFSGPLDFKGSVYARWARDVQMKEGALSPGKSPRGFLFGNKVRPAKVEPDFFEKIVGTTKDAEEKRAKVTEESKVRKMKGILFKYASFGRENSEKISSGERKAGFFSKLSFKFNGNESTSRKKKSMAANETMAMVEYKAKPSFGHCLGYGVTSPVKIK